MKARVDNRCLLLHFGLTAEQKQQLASLSKSVDCRLQEILPEDAGQTVGCLCGSSHRMKGLVSIRPAPKEPILILYKFNDAKMDTLLTALKAADLSHIQKAAVTKTNEAWSIAYLATELAKERDALHRAAQEDSDE